MSKDNRKSPRKPMSAIAFIYTIDGWPVGACKTIDISEGGAKIMWPSSEEVPIEFFLSLSKDGKVRRHCQLKWRAGNEIGIRFTLKMDSAKGRPRYSV